MSDDTNKPAKLDMDLISMVQNARMMNDQEAIPSQVSAVYWIEAKAPIQNPTPNAGTWVIPTMLDDVDALWEKIKTATKAGKLGYKAKVSTAPGKDQGMVSARVIHVRVADSTDAENIQRVREGLQHLGITEEIVFVPDKA